MKSTMNIIEVIKEKYPLLSDKKPEINFVYICLNGEWLLAVGQSTKNRSHALDGALTSQKHTKAGICMMASAIKGTANSLFYIPCIDKGSMDILEKNIKTIVRNHFKLTNKVQGGTYVDGISSNIEVGTHLKKLLLNKHAENLDFSFEEKLFSFSDILEIVNRDGDAWSNLVDSSLTGKVVEKFLFIQKKECSIP